MNDELNSKPRAKQVWIRGLFMILFAVIYSVTEIILAAVVVFQFFYLLITGDKNQRLLELGDKISVYIFQILQYLTFNTETQPYPLGDWPKTTERPASNTEIEQPRVVDES